MAAKAVVRDVARVQGKSYGLADKLSKMIPADPGMTLKAAYEQRRNIAGIFWVIPTHKKFGIWHCS